ncbi:unnamed protein product [Mytilus edulis]|uniref:Novel STAND NTPase 3 domain-containing protein n=1 Tax=Mytilus edulis TaxID=6550 RepID=A0A8S3UBF9_MYTED|nr:unnamed protein product [Mytilus edulis]
MVRLSTHKERENFYRISTIIVDHGKESLMLLLDNELNSNNQTLEDFINFNQHDIYHLCINRYACCQCKNGKLPLTTPASRVLHPDQLDILLDKTGQTLPCHNTKSVAQFCCCPAKATLTTKNLDLTFLRCLLINFATICPQNSTIRLAVDDLIVHRNKLYGHAQEARYSDTDYIICKSQLEATILTIAKSCNKESEMKQKLRDAEVRPLDETICQQYQNCLLYDIQRNEDITKEISTLREQSRQNIDQIVQQISETENTITTNISSHSKTTMEQLEGLQLDFAKRDDNLNERIQSNQVKLVDEVQEQTKVVIGTIEKEREVQQKNHGEQIGHLLQTERNIISKTKETTADIIKHVKQTGQEIQDKIDDLIVDIKQDHSIARIQSHRDDETFVHTMALNKGTNILKEENLLVLLAKGGSGKTQIALHLASAYNDEGYIPLFFSGKDVIKYQDLISLKYKNIVIVEDLFGRTNVDFHEDDHRNILDKLSSCLKRSKLLKIVFIIRNDPKCEENILAKHEIFHQKCILNLDYSLSDRERVTILLRHMRHNSVNPCKSRVKTDVCFHDWDPLPGCTSDCTADVKITICTDIIYACCMCDTFLGFPETCRMFCSDKSLTLLGVAYFRNTNKSLVDKVNDLFLESFEKLSCRYEYCVLVYTALKYNFFDENLIGCRIENDQLFKRIFSTFDEKEPKIRKTLVQQAIRKLEGRYLIHSSRYSDFYHDVCSYSSFSLGNAYMFKHQAVHDAVLVAFGSDNPDILLTLDICSLDFISQYIRPSLKQPDRNFSVIHVDPKLVIDKLLHFIEIEISTKNGRIVGFSNPWLPKPVNGQDDEEDSQEQTRRKKNDSYQSSDDLQTEETDIDQSSDDVPNCIDLEEEDPDSEKETDLSRFAFRCIRGYSEMAGEYIRKCIIEKRYASFVKTFLERLSTLSPPPDKMKDFLNGLTRRGTCLMNLMTNSDIVRDSALKYAEYNVFCLIFRPKSLTVNHYKFYQLDDETLQEKLISIINENKNFKIIAEIGNFLYRIGVEEGNFIFVERFLDSILERYCHLVDHYKIRYIIDGMSAKGRRKEVVSRFIEFMQTNLLTFGSIKTIIGLWEVIKTEINKNDENNTPLMSILEHKFNDHLLYGSDFEEGVNYKVQTQEYGAWVYNLSMEIQDNKFIEELLLNLNDIYELGIGCLLVCESANIVHFLVYFYEGFTNFGARKNDAEQMFPTGMEKLYCHIKRYKLFFKKVKESTMYTNSWGKFNIPYSYFSLLVNMETLNTESKDKDDNDGH